MSIREVAFAVGLTPDDSEQLSILNPDLLSVNYIAAGTVLKVPAAMTSLGSLLQRTGTFPGISIQTIPLQRTARVNGTYGVRIDRFLRYHFRSSIIVPVDAFSCEFAFPDDPVPVSSRIKSGDIVQIIVQGDVGEQVVSTGIIDKVQTRVSSAGEYVQVTGRDLIGQLDGQSVFSVDGEGIWAAQMTPSALFAKLQIGTRIPGLRLQGIRDAAYPLGMEPGETKLQVLLRYLEPINALPWSYPDGRLVLGRPNMNTNQPPSGTWIMSKSLSTSNVLEMQSVRAEATIPSFILPIWAAQVQVQRMVAKIQGIPNNAPGPKRLRELGHRVSKAVIVSEPSADRRDSLNFAATLQAVGLPNLLQTTALREMARLNMHELEVSASIPGHLNEAGAAVVADQSYMIEFDRDGISERMYLYDVEYSLDEKTGPRTTMGFVRMGTICAGVKFQ
jgi:prophage tail gpP-like protein